MLLLLNNKLVTRISQGYTYHYRIFKSLAPKFAPVFIFNGFLQSMRSWTKYIKYFIDDSNVIIADLPGAGSADTIKIGEFNLNILAELVNEIICETKSVKVDIIAASYGAGIAYSFARNYPEKVNHLTVAGVISKLPPETKIKIERSVEYIKNNQMRLFSNLMIENLLNSNYKSKITNFGLIERLLRHQFKSLSNNEKEKYIQNAHHLLNRFGIDELHSKMPFNLSQGEKQRVAIARAIANSADLIIADEPTSSLESKQGFEIVRLLAKYANDEGKCVVVASHDLRLKDFADRMIYLEDGFIKINS